MKFLLVLFAAVAFAENSVVHNKFCGFGKNHGICSITADGAVSCTQWRGGNHIDDFINTAGQTVTKRSPSGGKFVHLHCSTYKPALCAVTDTGKMHVWNRNNQDKTLTTGEYDAQQGKFVSCSVGVYKPCFGGLRDDGVVELFGYNRYLHEHRYSFDKDAGRVAQDGTWRRELPPQSITKYYANRDQDGWLSNNGYMNTTQPIYYNRLQERIGYDLKNAVDVLMSGGDMCAILEDGRAACITNSQYASWNTPEVRGNKYVAGGCAGPIFVCIPTDLGNVNCFLPQSPKTTPDLGRYLHGFLPRNFEPTQGKFVRCGCGQEYVCCQRDDGVIECPKKGTTDYNKRVRPSLNAAQEQALAAMNVPLSAPAGPSLPACPVDKTKRLAAECSCEGEASGCAIGKFCYDGGCKDNAQCDVRPDVAKNLFYGAKVYGHWNASTKVMSMNFTTPWDVSVSSMSWKNAASDQLKYTSAAMGLWKKDMTNACAPTYKLEVPQTTFFGAGSKFNIKGSQLSTTMRVVASETVTTVKNGQTYTYARSIKNTVPVLVNLVTKTTISVRFRSTIAEPGPGPAPKLEDFVLFIGAEDNFADEDPNVYITMQVHSRACIDHTLSTTGVAVTTGLDNIAPGKASEFTWKKDANGVVEKSFEHNMCVETLYWKFVPKQYRENTYEISLEFTLRGTGEKFTSIAAIDIKQGDVLSDIGFTTDIKSYDDELCTKPNTKFILGQKFYTKISLTDLIVNTNNITCNTYKIKQTKDGVTTTTDLKAEVKYAFMEKKAELNNHICGAELESHHFHISVDGYDTILETEILITYDQTNTRRKLIQVPFTEEMFNAAGYDLTDELALGDAELSEEDMAFRETKRAPDTDDMVVEMFIEAEKEIASIFTSETMQSFQNLIMIGAVIGCAGFAFGYVSNKFKSDQYVSLIEMQE